MKSISVHGFGGGFALGAVQEGWELSMQFTREKGFGVYSTLANRHLLGDTWGSVCSDPVQWEKYPANLVYGNPPCSGFSTLSRKEFRGMGSSINDYMWDLARYAGMVAPEIVIFESVQQAFRQGLPLMRQLCRLIEEMSGKSYTLIHVLHNNASLGGISTRKRYFFVAARVPFGVGRYHLDYVPQFGDMLRDLEPLGLTLQSQPYKGVRIIHSEECNVWMSARPGEWECTCPVEVMNSSRWCRENMHDGTGWVDGHDILRSPSFDRVLELLQLEEWKEGENISAVLRRYYEKNGKLPGGWYYDTKIPALDADGNPIPLLDENGVHVADKKGKLLYKVDVLPKADQLIRTDFAMGHNQQARWHWGKLARVITGGACHLVVHPHLPRTLTQREAARVQGFPDSWKIWPVRHAPDLGPGWGKGVPVHTGRWIAKWARMSLEGTPGPITGIPLEMFDKKLFKTHGTYDRPEFVIDVTNDYKPFAIAFGDKG